MGGAMALYKAWTPKLALDLAGGTTVTLTPVTLDNKAPTQEALDQAVNILRNRVNGSGLSDAEVARTGDNIIISVPGAGQKETVEKVGKTAELRFRQVIAMEVPAVPEAMQTEAPVPSGSPSASPSGSPQPSQSVQPSQSAAPKASASASPTGKAVSSALTTTSPSPSPSPSASPSASPKASANATPSAQPSQQPQQGQMVGSLEGVPADVLKQFQALDCADPAKNGQGVQDDPNKMFATCDKDGVKYVLDTAKVVGTDIDTASAGMPQGRTEWIVQLSFKGKGPAEWSKLTTKAYNSQQPQNQVAVVLDGQVITAPQIINPIPGGQAEITGGFTQASATELADQLKYGSLPLKFNLSSAVTVSSTLGADQLEGGIISGLIGLALVVVYCLLYYRGLGIVAVLSLVVASIVTYQAVVILGAGVNFRLSLPHIIGLIVSIGITADSFIVYFERIRDEMKEGRRTLRAAVEVAWVRARRTILIADAVMFICAVVLYFLAVGGVAGFAFAMGLTTLIDIVVVFLFTKPLIALLARLKFFAKGHKLSGLDAERMAADLPKATTTPQEA
ncbi:protein translocase subunit SecD [Nonomuraea soli]|uniref:Protein translocase subunit SecD n=1 Tax=Nonomuraea soli TaxID=1032476 RepID=A0A7W0CQA2_9ACTN|nr:protein translocase subunit SecD [Nonomuraea soli]MBA2895145.1 preprotein translocase subunit SecD [Nonomuraea soli]